MPESGGIALLTLQNEEGRHCRPSSFVVFEVRGPQTAVRDPNLGREICQSGSQNNLNLPVDISIMSV